MRSKRVKGEELSGSTTISLTFLLAKYCIFRTSILPYDDDDSIKDIVGVSQVVEGAKCSEFE